MNSDFRGTYRQLKSKQNNIKTPMIYNKKSTLSFRSALSSSFDLRGKPYSFEMLCEKFEDKLLFLIPDNACEVCIDQLIFNLKDIPESHLKPGIVSNAKSIREGKLFIDKYGLEDFDVLFYSDSNTGFSNIYINRVVQKENSYSLVSLKLFDPFDSDKQLKKILEIYEN